MTGGGLPVPSEQSAGRPENRCHRAQLDWTLTWTRPAK